MNNQIKSDVKLSTNRSFAVFMLRGVCSLAILAIIDMWQMQCDLNTILKPYTPKRSNFLFFGGRSCKLMNEEMARRGIDYKLNTFIFMPSKAITALNLLSADYNERGC